MAIAYSQEFVVGIYTSPNLIGWTRASKFSHHGLLGLQYQCPNLVQMHMEGSDTPMFLLYISINPGAPLGGSIGQYFPGFFDGTHFTAIDEAVRIADFGKDNYAGQFFYGTPGTEQQIFIAWASNWQYCNDLPTGVLGWRSIMALPRYNYLTNLTRIGYDLVSTPYNVMSIADQELAFNSSLGNGSLFADYSTVPSGALYFSANITGLDSATLGGTVNFTFSSSTSGEQVRDGTMIGGDTWVDRRYTRGFENPYFTDKFSSTGIYGGNGTWRIEGVIDRSIIEAFVNGGVQSATTIFFPTQPLDTAVISARGIADDVTVSAAIWSLQSGWAPVENMNGAVVGNVTTGSSRGNASVKFF